MTNKSLILGIVALCALPAASEAQVLLSEDFNGLTPTAPTFNTGTMVLPGTDFTATQFRIEGSPASTTCRSPASGSCIALQNALGELKSTNSVLFKAGDTYALSFDLVGNARTSAATASTVTVTLGSLFDHTYTLANGVPTSFDVVNTILRPTSDISAQLIFHGAGPSRTDGMIIDNIDVRNAPEPATLGLLALGLLGGAGAGFVRRKRAN
jgi:hypothetical protein